MTELDTGIEVAARQVRDLLAGAHEGLVARELLVETVALCAVAGEHLLVVGPPGTAKSQAVRRVAAGLGGRYFEYLLGRFTEPNEVFGPIDLQRLRDGVVDVRTEGMLPEADVAFLDEVFLGSTAILNTLLGILNERTFRRGSTSVACPLRVCVGATNTLPEDPALAAFADRFLARVFVGPVPDARLEEMFEAGRAAQGPPPAPAPGTDPLAAIDRLAAAAVRCDLAGVHTPLATAVRRLRAAGIPLSDRRAVRTQQLVAAAAVLDGRTRATLDDLWVLPLVAPTPDAQAQAQEVLADLVGGSRSGTLVHAAEELSRGRRAQAERLVATGTRLLDTLAPGAQGPDADTVPLDRDERLRVEATLREIDACFAVEDLPDDLATVRGRLVDVVRA